MDTWIDNDWKTFCQLEVGVEVPVYIMMSQ